MSTDGKEEVKLCDDYTEYLVLSEGWIYYSNSSDGGKIYKMKTDGTEKTKLADDNITWFMSVVGDWVYYFNDDEKRLYKIKTDGTGRTESPVISEKEILPT